MKLWRFDSFDNQVSLGRGDVVMDEHKNADTIKKHSYLDRHQITLERPAARFHTGITIVVEEAPERPLAVCPGEPYTPLSLLTPWYSPKGEHRR